MATTFHGKNGMFYLGSPAEIISEAAEYSIDLDFDTDPDPALGDTWETRLKGLSRFSGAVNGNFDGDQDTLWDSAIATTAQSFYLYPDRTVTTKYYYGNIWPKLSIDGGVSGKIAFSCSFEGQGQLAKNPA